MKTKTIDAIISDKLVSLIDKLRELKVQREDVVTVFIRPDSLYVAIFYS